MKPAKTICPPQWMQEEDLRLVIQALGSEEAYCVGGSVRNILLDTAVSDIDIATQHAPNDVMERLGAANIRFVPTGLKHGTITAVTDAHKYQITSLREDVETDGRHAKIAFTKDWKKDAARRDFTINTMLADLEGNIYDPLGVALSDLDRRRVVFVGDARQRIKEDYLRILRFFRFHSCFGEGDPDPAGLKACKQEANGIDSLSKERITEEFLKIVLSRQAVQTIEQMKGCEILTSLIHQNYNPDILRRASDTLDSIARLLILSAFDADHLSELGHYLTLSNKQIGEFLLLAGAYENFQDTSEKQIKVMVYQYGNEVTYQVLQLYQAAQDTHVGSELLECAQNWQAPDFPTNGDDLIAQGYKPGKELGEKLMELEQQWIEETF